MKIGVYGGTFNPIHFGHINLIEGFKEKLKLDKILIIPTATPPHKQTHELASANDRLNMCKIALENYDFCEVSDIEIKREGKSFTADTLTELAEKNPNDKFFLLMGEDMFLTVNKWKNSEIIFKLATICVAPRSLIATQRLREHGEKLKNHFSDFEYLIAEIPFVDISSTQIRNGEENFLPIAVKEYIKKNNLF
ncbi:MAG: nicotinate (nicotinamide) nucleotide adenylyltransferase [Clostridia bacterium]